MLNAEKQPLPPWRVFIIDDSPDDRAEIRRMLLKGSERRFTFVEAETAAAGISAALWGIAAAGLHRAGLQPARYGRA